MPDAKNNGEWPGGGNATHYGNGKKRLLTKGAGRPKGQIGMYSKIIRDAVLLAGNKADKDGLVGYLTKQANKHPAAFMQLLGKAMPLQLQAGDRGGRVIVEIVRQAGQRVQSQPAPKLIEGEVIDDEELKREVRGLKQPEWDDSDIVAKLESRMVQSMAKYFADDVIDLNALTKQVMDEALEEIKRLRGELKNCEEQVARLKKERQWKP